MLVYAAFCHQVKTLAREMNPEHAVPPRMATSPEVPQNFETALAELEAIVASMEGGQLPLQESLAAYKRGAELVAFCQTALKDAQQQIEILEKGVLRTFAPDGGDDAP
jgi:exodeoxyribonuclease VII small subunit